jgi:hypothetical protein
MNLKIVFKNKLFASVLGALVVTLSQGSFKLSLFIISFVIIYVLLWGYDNPEEGDAYK